MSGVPDPIPGTPDPKGTGEQASDGDRSAPSTIEVCPLCGVPVAGSDMRCANCNRSLAGVGNRPGPFSRRDVVLWATTIVAIYVAVMLVVYAAR